MHEIAHYNWAGLAFVSLVFPAAGAVTIWLRRWSERIEGGPSRGKIQGGVHTQILPDRRVHGRRASDQQPGEAIGSQEHACAFDLARSRVVLCGNGSTMVECAIPGCEVTKTYPANAVVPVRSR